MTTDTTEQPVEVEPVEPPPGTEPVEPPPGTTEDAPQEAHLDLPDMSSVMAAELYEGVLRYRGLSAVEAQEAEKHRVAAVRCDEVSVEYLAKAAALADIMTRVGMEPPPVDAAAIP